MNELIKVDTNSLYTNGVLVSLDNGDVELVREAIAITATQYDKYHQVTSYDRLDLIAYKYYKDESSDAGKLWWVIAEANDILNPLDLEDFVGDFILIPQLSRIKLKL